MTEVLRRETGCYGAVCEVQDCCDSTVSEGESYLERTALGGPLGESYEARPPPVSWTWVFELRLNASEEVAAPAGEGPRSGYRARRLRGQWRR
jgi:hypothetical protein